MQPFRVHKGRVAPLDRVNVDTDQIIPKQFLKRIERTGFGKFLFYDWRRAEEKTVNLSYSTIRAMKARVFCWSERILGAAPRANTRSGRWRISGFVR